MMISNMYKTKHVQLQLLSKRHVQKMTGDQDYNHPSRKLTSIFLSVFKEMYI
ncbi:MAG: hypothetical protein ACJAXX_003181 [Roseivirga sp.]|jgi:hypothetical protein